MMSANMMYNLSFVQGEFQDKVLVRVSEATGLSVTTLSRVRKWEGNFRYTTIKTLSDYFMNSE
jgi:hypothetical protein